MPNDFGFEDSGRYVLETDGPDLGETVIQRLRLATGSHICKFNIGTELRMVFGAALREAVEKDPNRFDRIAILKETHIPVMEAARLVLRGLGSSGRV